MVGSFRGSMAGSAAFRPAPTRTAPLMKWGNRFHLYQLVASLVVGAVLRSSNVEATLDIARFKTESGSELDRT